MTTARLRTLKITYERLGDTNHVQLGPFGDVLSDDDAELIARLAFGFCNEEPASLTLTLDSSMGSAQDVTRSVTGLADITSLRVSDRRGALLRGTGLGTVGTTWVTSSISSLVALLMSAWPLGRVLICTDDALGPRDTSWMSERADLPPVLPRPGATVLLSFFHGAWLSIYDRARDRDGLVAVVTRTAAALGRDLVLEQEPF